ncbi:MAG: acetyl-CoA synthase subunit gamma [Deltaproteobacteria bacterium RBG_16_48_10]|nr:MAG: acetyl-CoA synthase subunit gamma [Deltaproteobacteria bacterium RBG_16_48_10]
MTGSIQTAAGPVPQVSSPLSWRDHLGTWKARWGINRMNYIIDPGLYAMGKPDEKSPVLVTAHYKLSFDKLRKELPDRNLWILVLDTKGINVWCSAGKGTFGTTELVGRIESSGLGQIISHRELILPQLSGPGVAAHQVKKLSGFKVIYGPIRAKDLPAFLDNGFKATAEMRLKTFTTWERIVLIPIELVEALKAGVIIILGLFLLSFLGRLGGGWANALSHGLFSALAILTAILAGAVLTPMLLPWLPGRAFSLKGLCLGLLAAVVLTASRWSDWITIAGRLEIIAWFLLIPALSAYLAMNFTGASTYTSLSGVRKEMRWALPLQISAAIVGLILWLGSQFVV